MRLCGTKSKYFRDHSLRKYPKDQFLGIFLFVKTCDLYNYADDSTLSYADKDPVNLKAVLESESQNLISCPNSSRVPKFSPLPWCLSREYK